MMDDAIEIDVEDHEEIVERVAAIDVAKASGKVCTRVPAPNRPGPTCDEGLGRDGDDERHHGAGRATGRRGMLRPSFVPPLEIRRLRGYTRLRLEQTEERSRHTQRTEKLLEDALIKLSTVASDIMGVSGRAMIEALIAGERDPHVLAALAKGRMRVKHAALVEALTGQFDDHHAERLESSSTRSTPSPSRSPR